MIGAKRSSAAELTLAAALRDITSPRAEARGIAIRNLAPALLDELDLRPPTWWRGFEHPRRDEAVAALEQACADSTPQNAALARIGLAQLGAPQTEPRAFEVLGPWGAEQGEDSPDDDAAMFARECAVIALAKLGAAARAWLAEPGSVASAETPAEGRAEAEALLARLTAALSERLADPRDDVRFQAGPALIEVAGAAAEPELLAALDREAHPEIRENLVSAIAQLDPPSPAACDALARVLAGDEGSGWVGWEAALALAAVRRPEGATRLIAGLRTRETRDQALEALALLGPAAGPEAAPAVRRYLDGFLTPVFTKVRAAYALARVAPEREGLDRLDRLAKHPRPGVREAVAEARALLAQLEATPNPSDRHAYRRG